MNFISIFAMAFSFLGAIDYIIGNKIGIGREFKKAFELFCPMALSMIGMLVIAPAVGVWLAPVFDGFYSTFGIDPSIIPASLLANDMGGTSLALTVAKSETVGKFNALVVSSMMGCIISYTIPFTMSMVKQERHKELFLGLICGIITVPIGCFAAGLVSGLSFSETLLDLSPIIILSVIIGIALIFAKKICIMVFTGFGIAIRAIGVSGLFISMFSLLSGRTINPNFDSYSNAAYICAYGCVTLSGMLPAMYLLSRLLEKPLKKAGGKLRINATSTLGLMGTLVTISSTFGVADEMDKKGLVLNSAFGATGAFVFGGHLAFTMIYDTDFAFPMIVGKLVSGICAIFLALAIYKESDNNTLQN